MIERNNYLLECLHLAGISELPEKKSKEDYFSHAIALIKRTTGLYDYVLAKKEGDKIRIKKDFGFGIIKEVVDVFPYEKTPKGQYELSVDKESLDNVSKCKFYLNKIAEERGDESLRTLTKNTKKLVELKEIIKNL